MAKITLVQGSTGASKWFVEHFITFGRPFGFKEGHLSFWIVCVLYVCLGKEINYGDSKNPISLY